MEKSGKDIEEILIDYADGLLAPGENEQVAKHLAECTNCRELIKTLQKSLELAKVIWNDNVAKIEKIAIPKARRGTWHRYIAAVASIVVITAICLTQLKEAPPTEPPLTFEEIERKISNAASAARLLAATELLTEQPDHKSFVQQQYRYIVKMYPETSSAVKAKMRLQ